MLTCSKLIAGGQGLAAALLKRAPTVELDWDVRQKSRFDCTDSQGRTLGVFLARGTAVRGGDVLVDEVGEHDGLAESGGGDAERRIAVAERFDRVVNAFLLVGPELHAFPLGMMPGVLNWRTLMNRRPPQSLQPRLQLGICGHVVCGMESRMRTRTWSSTLVMSPITEPSRYDPVVVAENALMRDLSLLISL